MLNRKYTEAMQRLAKAHARLEVAEEKMQADFLKWCFPVERRQSATATPCPTASSQTRPKQPEKK
jgi:hypothetical protein